MAARPRRSTTPEWEWLSLIDSDGPFLSRAALKSFHPSGLPSDLDADKRQLFTDEFVRCVDEHVRRDLGVGRDVLTRLGLLTRHRDPAPPGRVRPVTYYSLSPVHLNELLDPTT